MNDEHHKAITSTATELVQSAHRLRTRTERLIVESLDRIRGSRELIASLVGQAVLREEPRHTDHPSGPDWPRRDRGRWAP